MLSGWPGTKYANREFTFERDDHNQLLHCKLNCASELALVARGSNFYQPDELPSDINKPEASDVILEIRSLYEYFSHPSMKEMKRVANKWFKDKVITYQDPERWYELEGKYSCCFSNNPK